MAKKNNTVTAEQANEALDLLKNFVAQNGGSEADESAEDTETEETEEGDEEVSLPTKEELDEMSKDELIALAGKIELDVSGLKEKAIKALFSTLIAVLDEESEEEVEADAINALANAFGITPAKKAEATVKGIREFIANLGASDEESEESEASDEESSDDDDSEEEEKPKSKKSKKDDEESEDESDEESEESEDEESEEESEDEESEDEDDEKPKGKKSKKSDDDEESEDEESEEESDEESEDSEDEEEEEIDVAEKKARVAAYNKAVKKPVKKYEEIVAKLDGNKWGVAYMDGDEACCCGVPMTEAEEVDGRPHGICKVTGAHFLLNEDGDGFDAYTPKAKKKTT